MNFKFVCASPIIIKLKNSKNDIVIESNFTLNIKILGKSVDK